MLSFQVTIFSLVATQINAYGFLGLLFGTLLIPPFTLVGSLFIFSEVSRFLLLLPSSSVKPAKEVLRMRNTGQVSSWHAVFEAVIPRK